MSPQNVYNINGGYKNKNLIKMHAFYTNIW